MGVPTQVKSHPIGLLRHRRIVFIATLGETICAFEGAGWTKVQASVAFPGRQCCLALRVFVRCKVDHGQSWRGGWLSDHQCGGGRSPVCGGARPHWTYELYLTLS